MFKFITEPEEKKEPTFADVKENQFFVNIDGYLCQKTSYNRFNYIANLHGQPYSHSAGDILSSMRILRICPIVKKIEF